jgi:Arc/MetJ-type ribon-helix-helix transcriptional regulator
VVSSEAIFDIGQDYTMKNNKVTIKIPRQLYIKIQQLVEDSGFNSATDFIVFVLRDLIIETEGSGRDESDEFSPEELAALKKKLKNLGYL